MEKQKPFSIKKRIRSFKYAFTGIWFLLKAEHNARIHLAASIAVVVLGFVMKISNVEWLAVAIVIGLVFMAEAFNSSIEKLCDTLAPEKSENIKYVKDVAAAAVLFMAIAAAVVGVLVFLPKIMACF